MGRWSVVIPEATENVVVNSSFEAGVAGWATGGTNTIARSSEQSLWGSYGLKATYQNNTSLAIYSVTLTAVPWTFSCWVWVPADWNGAPVTLRHNNFVGSSGASMEATLVGQWQRLAITFTPNAGDLTGDLLINTAGPPSVGRFIYVDGVQIEQKSYLTTYCDGDQPGCEWMGAVHGSVSRRAATARRGGRVRDIENDLGVQVQRMYGVGAPPVQLNSHNQALRDGALPDATRFQARVMSLQLQIQENDLVAYHARRRGLLRALVSPVEGANEHMQPVALRYTGQSPAVEILARYENGLELNGPEDYLLEKTPLRLRADDPFFYQAEGEKSQALATSATATFRVVAGLLDGVWNPLGPPSAAGTYSSVNAMALHGDYLYVGGNFTNWNGIANGNRIVRYHLPTGVWIAMGTGMDGPVFGLAVDAAGNVYACGSFTTAGGGAASRIARWNGSAWSALGTGLGAQANDVAIASNGDVYVCGEFTTAGGGGANRIARWNGSAWSALSTGLGATANGLAIDNLGNVYVVGSFTSPSNRIAMWNGSAWIALGTGLNNIGRAVAIADDGMVYVGGQFTTAGGVGANYIARWNGSAFFPLGSGGNADVFRIFLHQGNLWAGGLFTVMGGITLPDRIARWNGSSWAAVDCDFPGSPTILGMAMVGDRLYFGFDSTGTATHAGSATVSCTGTARAWPVITIKRSGGTAATLIRLANATTGAELLFDYGLLDGETLTIDLRPAAAMVAYSSHRGPVPGAILANSDVTQFFLAPGVSARDNVITAFVNPAGSPTVTAFVRWRDTYLSVD